MFADDGVFRDPHSHSYSDAVRRLPFPDNIAAAVLLQAIADLKSGHAPRRADARAALLEGGLHWWLERMSLGPAAYDRVRALLDDLVRKAQGGKHA